MKYDVPGSEDHRLLSRVFDWFDDGTQAEIVGQRKHRRPQEKLRG